MADEVVVEIEVGAPPDVVYRMFTDPAELVRWIGVSAECEPVPGGRFRFELFPGEFCSGAYVHTEPGRRVVFTWGWESGRMAPPPGSSTVDVELSDLGDRTRVRLVHSGLDAASRDLHADGWDRFLTRLLAVVQDDPVPADPAAPYADGREPVPPKEA